ncbi:B-cell lymphoma 3 protein [Recurvomyces mirabilis]|uniref:B-cell lymphoma 3 protein n=1 Tax=Recurvomyces mirabilis TaxID=574656 RepID=A0AAE0WWF5_9PEZI|nr:B-cell lymphoma 3 protein [Recurvomyces mirabilis]KAK5158674.1 putative ankyrin-repeat protein [Recurvomyces mirabilis]
MRNDVALIRTLLKANPRNGRPEIECRIPLEQILRCRPGLRCSTLELINVFAEHGADVSININAGGHLLLMAVRQNEVSLTQTLLEHGAKTQILNAANQTPLEIAMFGNDAIDSRSVDVLRLLLRYCSNLDTTLHDGSTLLHRAVEARCPERVRLLLEAKAGRHTHDQHGRTPLHAVINDKTRLDQTEHDMIELLLENRTNATAQFDVSNVIFHIGVEIQTEALSMFVQHSVATPSASQPRATRFQEAVWNRYFQYCDGDTANILMTAYKEAKGSDGEINTPLHGFARAVRINERLADTLRSHGADLQALNCTWGNSLALALRLGKLDAAQAST